MRYLSLVGFCLMGVIGSSVSCAMSGWLSMGGNHGCAVTNDSLVQCWGDDSAGQLGDGTMNALPTPYATQTANSSVVDTNIAMVATGEIHSCALKAAGSVLCWGGNVYGQLGIGGQPGQPQNRASSGYVGNIGPLGPNFAKKIAAGKRHTCTALNDGQVACWGFGLEGQLGNGNTQTQTLPVFVQGISTATNLVAGASHTCALLQDKTVRCWGRNNEGQLGNGVLSATPQPTPQSGNGLSNVTVIAAGGNSTCAIGSGLDGIGLYCWGQNDVGQVGNGNAATSVPAPTLALLQDAPAGTTITDVVLGNKHACARINSNTVHCWGLNDKRQLGNGGTANSSSPVLATEVSPVRYLAAGGDSTCARRLNDDVTICWGDNTYGQLGNGTMDPQPSVVESKALVSGQLVSWFNDVLFKSGIEVAQ